MILKTKQHVFSLSSSSNANQFSLLNKVTVLSSRILVPRITLAALFWSLNTLRRFSLLVKDHISPLYVNIGLIIEFVPSMVGSDV